MTTQLLASLRHLGHVKRQSPQAQQGHVLEAFSIKETSTININLQRQHKEFRYESFTGLR